MKYLNSPVMASWMNQIADFSIWTFGNAKTLAIKFSRIGPPKNLQRCKSWQAGQKISGFGETVVCFRNFFIGFDGQRWYKHTSSEQNWGSCNALENFLFSSYCILLKIFSWISLGNSRKFIFWNLERIGLFLFRKASREKLIRNDEL